VAAKPADPADHGGILSERAVAGQRSKSRISARM